MNFLSGIYVLYIVFVFVLPNTLFYSKLSLVPRLGVGLWDG